MAQRKGKCLCGAIQYTVEGEPSGVAACYCSDCSKNAGSAFQLSAGYDKSSIQITQGEENIGRYTIFNTTSGKPKHKDFSKCCGCTLWTNPTVAGENSRVLRTALLEGGLQDLKPKVEFFTKNRPAYLSPTEGAKQFETYPVDGS